MRIVVAAWAAACVLPLTLPKPAAAEVVIHVNKSTQHMLVLVDGTERYNWLVTTGARRYGTPNGIYQPYRFNRFWRSRKYGNAPMPHSIFFYQGYAIHGTTEIKTLGRIGSHGCVRLHPNNAKALFALVQSEVSGPTRIVISDDPYTAPPPLPLPLPLQPPAPPAEAAVVADAGGALENTGTLESSDLLEIALDADASEAVEPAEVQSAAFELPLAVSTAPEPARQPPTEIAQPAEPPRPVESLRPAETKTAPTSKPEKSAEPPKTPVRSARVSARVAANTNVGFHW